MMRTIPVLYVYPKSMAVAVSPGQVEIACFLAREQSTGERILGVRGLHASAELPFSAAQYRRAGEQFFALNAENAAVLRQFFPWLNPQPLEPSPESCVEKQPSFGFGDRLGLATPGHIQALRAALPETAIAPIFAQQSVRENARTGRTPQQVLDEAMWGVFQEGWSLPWGADADHLKQVSDLPAFVQAGYSFFTIDPGDHVDPAADTDSLETLQAKAVDQPWGELDTMPASLSELTESFQSFCAAQGLDCVPEALSLEALRAAAKYGRAVIQIGKMYRSLLALKPGGFDFEVSVDETESPTSVLEHFYIASELSRLGVRFNSLAPRLPGRFEKGVDYIGDLAVLEQELARHAAVVCHFGGYKLSLHSGSDKFSVYPLLARHAGRAVHVKTAGTSYLEALRVAAQLEPALFRQALELARQRYPVDRQSYHVSANEQLLPTPDALVEASLPALLDDFHVRQALHVTYGSALTSFGPTLMGLLQRHPAAYEQVLQRHFRRHLEPLAAL